MSGREAILGKLRKAAGAKETDTSRAKAVAERLGRPIRGLVPARGNRPDDERVEQFCVMAEQAAATVERLSDAASVPAAVGRYLRSKNLAPELRMGADRRLAKLPWEKQKSLTIHRGRAMPEDEVGVSFGFAGIAETGTVALPSGPDNPSTVNFLPDHHIIVLDAKDIAGNLETVISRLRRKFKRGVMPRMLNLITGPSRSGDIEQTMLLGAHGPRALHILVIDG